MLIDIPKKQNLVTLFEFDYVQVGSHFISFVQHNQILLRKSDNWRLDYDLKKKKKSYPSFHQYDWLQYVCD